MIKKINSWLSSIINKDKINALEIENKALKAELVKKGSVFLLDSKYLGFNKVVHGVVVENKVIALKECIYTSEQYKREYLPENYEVIDNE